MTTPEWLTPGLYGTAIGATAPGMDAPDRYLATARIDVLPFDES